MGNSVLNRYSELESLLCSLYKWRGYASKGQIEVKNLELKTPSVNTDNISRFMARALKEEMEAILDKMIASTQESLKMAKGELIEEYEYVLRMHDWKHETTPDGDTRIQRMFEK
jgi:hypothetical protein